MSHGTPMVVAAACGLWTHARARRSSERRTRAANPTHGTNGHYVASSGNRSLSKTSPAQPPPISSEAFDATILLTARRTMPSSNNKVHSKGNTSANTRIEHDLLGDFPVPADAYYGVQTARALENFRISGIE